MSEGIEIVDTPAPVVKAAPPTRVSGSSRQQRPTQRLGLFGPSSPPLSLEDRRRSVAGRLHPVLTRSAHFPTIPPIPPQNGDIPPRRSR